MIGLPLGFASPLVLLGLLSLPILWYLLRLVPPRPQRVEFPPARLLFDIDPKEDTPAQTPWWLTLLRLLLAALVIFAAAGPLWNPTAGTASSDTPLMLILDDGITAAATWDERVRTGDQILARAEANGRGIVLVPLSEMRQTALETPAAARVQLAQLRPKPYSVERADALPTITRLLSDSPGMEVVWLSDGTIREGQGDFVAGLAKAAEGHSVTVIAGGLAGARALSAADNAAGSLTVNVLRGRAEGNDQGLVRALDLKGLPLGETAFTFPAGAPQTQAQFNLPVEIRNDIARLEIAGERSAGAVQLLDDRWRRRTIGIVSGTGADTAQPLLASTFYLGRALNPFADVRVASSSGTAESVDQFIKQNVPMMILADVGTVTGDTRDTLSAWIEDGGVLVRFAGPRLAAGDDDLVPVRLRRGGRTLGGSLSWDKPQELATFSPQGPFASLEVPKDVKVQRQVLAEPDANLSERTWASLADGTPLVTAERRGKGLVVLFHVTADTRWSDLPLSGGFVAMLRQIVGLAGTTAATPAEGDRSAREMIPPTRLLDGFGAFGPPPPSARPVASNHAARANADHPPGFYGPPDGMLAVNALAPDDRLAPLDFGPLGANVHPFQVGEPVDLRGPVLTAALGLLLLDALIVFFLAGGIAQLWRRRRAAASILVATALMGHSFSPLWIKPALAQPQAPQSAAGPSLEELEFALMATGETRLAYVTTGNSEADAISKAGLEGLTRFMAQRTALSAGEPVGLDIARDELSFFPLIYWPIVPGAPRPSPEALNRIDAYMRNGGAILFDTRDAGEAVPGSSGGANNTPGMAELRAILGSLDIPELEPVPREHVLTKTFFILNDFPGRFNTGQLWVEAMPAVNEEQAMEDRPARAGDGVSSIMITSNDLAGAWALHADGRAMLPMNSDSPRQREFAFRAGVNIVMYVLTGNYKADQVHVPALLERLGQ